MNDNIKSQVINDVIVAMTMYISSEALQILEKVITEELVNVSIEKMNTLPMEMKDSIDQQNEYIIKLFLYKKKKLSEGTKYLII